MRHALDGDRGLGDGGGQHDFAAAGRGGSNGAVLLVAGERAVERYDIGRRIETALELRRGAADFGSAGKKRQQRALIGAHGAHDGVGDLRFDRARITAEIARLDREGAARGLDYRSVAEGFCAQKLCHARAVDRRRHDQKPQILAQSLLRVARQRQAEIGIQRALVKFVEKNCGDTVEHGIVEDQSREDALGDDLDAGAGGYFGAEAHP